MEGGERNDKSGEIRTDLILLRRPNGDSSPPGTKSHQ